MSHSLPHCAADDLSAADHPPVLDAYASIVVSAGDAPDECTIFPLFASDADTVMTWITAAEGSFVSLASMR
ncbi:DUF7511 domain-containing protein [Salinigranum sp. GCM10025319]|uniref:DUF7511 domain-containing protein n=1 Tax=Salinigranum sp. GCM10025319 TaxID=3252687 RepID=UPI003615B441